ncbi:MAG TPA: AAA family ATPase [Burkholderiales bacterium]|nr:AAA family ATPase [Burkholderiales bacterium]
MYLQYFGLSAQPFRLTPDSDFLFMSESHSRAKAYMDYTVWNREGFVVITGEIGCGKTTLIQKLLSELDENVVVAKVFQTQLDEVEFLQAVLVEFGLNPFNAKKVELLDMLNNFLIEQFLQRKQIVLIVDDAHNLSVKVLEEIRMFAGLETRKEKILHVILVGQPQLNEMLDYPDMQQLMQRVKLRYHIRALTERELGDYIRHRLSIVGVTNRTLFPPEALPPIFKYAGGIPRLINTLCDTTLTCAYADNLPGITAEVVEAAAKELQWPPYAERIDKHRATARRGSSESGVREILQEQSQKLGVIAARVGKIEELSPALESIGKSLAAIEAHLRNLAQSRNVQPRPDSTANPRQKSG